MNHGAPQPLYPFPSCLVTPPGAGLPPDPGVSIVSPRERWNKILHIPHYPPTIDFLDRGSLPTVYHQSDLPVELNCLHRQTIAYEGDPSMDEKLGFIRQGIESPSLINETTG